MTNALPTFTYDALSKLLNAGTVLNGAAPGTTGNLVGSVVDLGGNELAGAQSDGAAALYNGVVVIDLAALFITTDQLYEFILVGSQRADMNAAAGLAATPKTYQVPLSGTYVGHQDALFASSADFGLKQTVPGRLLLPFSNYQGGDWYRYVQLWARVTGTTPSVTLGAYIARQPTI